MQLSRAEAEDWIVKNLSDRISWNRRRWSLDGEVMTVPQIWVRAVVPLMEERGVYVPGNVPGMHQIFANINLRLWEGRDRNAG